MINLPRLPCYLDFENVDRTVDNMVWYWLGRTKQQFRELEAELPDFQKRATVATGSLPNETSNGRLR